MKTNNWRLILFIAAMITGGSGCGEDEAAPNASVEDIPTELNEDGSPAAELVSPNSQSIDDQIAMNRRIVSCLEDAGFDAELDDEGRSGYSYTVPEGRETDAADADDMCYEEFSPESVDYTPEEMERLYHATVRHAECLEAEAGVDVPEAPTLETWMENNGKWVPAEALAELSVEDDSAARRACPLPR